MNLSKLFLCSLALVFTLPAAPQQVRSNAATSAPTAVPPLIPYSGTVATFAGKQPATEAAITFLIFKDQQGGEPLFTETQSVAVDAAGHYNTQLGATFTNGIPMDLFATGEARWLEVQIAGGVPQPRVLLVSVPYALKAADAATLGGLPPSAFALARPASEDASPVSAPIVPNVTSNVTTTGGTVGFVSEFSGTSSVVNSPIFVNTTGLVGIGTTTPTATLNVNGSTTLNGQLLLPATGIASAAKGFSSQLVKIYTSAFNSSTSAVVQPRFEWEGEVTGNDTATPGATLNLLSSTTASNAAETGFFFNSNGTIHFAPGQTFPGGTGTGTITGVTAGTALTGGGTSGVVTLKVDTTKVPLLATSNTFTGFQTINGNLSVSGTASVGVVNAATTFNLGGSLFAFGSTSTQNAYLGFSGNLSSSGLGDTGIGVEALASNTTGFYNTATGFGALGSNTTGATNTASGTSALAANTSGNDNTAVGFQSLEQNTIGTDNTAAGSNALVLNTTGTWNTANGWEALYENTDGGENTASGASTLVLNTHGGLNTAVGFTALYANTTGSENTASGVGALSSNTTGFGNTASGVNALGDNNTTGSNNTASGLEALYLNTAGSNSVGVGFEAGLTKDNSKVTGSYNTAIGSNTVFGTGSITNATAIGANAEVDQSNTLILGCVASGQSCLTTVSVGIGTTTPDNLLTVNGNADKPGGGSWGTYSDGRLKTVNGSFGSGLGQVMQLRPIRYRYKPDNGMGIRDADEHIGVVAQEVQRVIPEAVTENGKGYLLVNNDPIIWSMVNAIKQQQREIEQQRKLLRAQSAINEEQGKLLRAQSAAMQSLAKEVRETRKTLRQVKAQAASGQVTMVASK